MISTGDITSAGIELHLPPIPKGYRHLEDGEKVTDGCLLLFRFNKNLTWQNMDVIGRRDLVGWVYDRNINPDFHILIPVEERMIDLGPARFNPVISGVGKDAPTQVAENGAKQSHLDYAFHLMDPLPLFELAKVLAMGAEKYGEWNWRLIPVEDNLNHALTHIFAYLAGDKQDDHLAHALCRVFFALSLELTPEQVERMTPRTK